MDYLAAVLLGRVSILREPVYPESIETVDLLWLCVGDSQNSAAWSEFLRRILSKLKHFVGGALHQSGNGLGIPFSRVVSLENNLDDLVQSTLVRLIENDYAVLKRFVGKNESDLFAYLAIIARSVVRDCCRRQCALKRTRSPERRLMRTHLLIMHSRGYSDYYPIERSTLVQELLDLAERACDDADSFSDRDRLIFNLYVVEDLSAAQIACCRGIGLSKPGVEKVLSRLKNRIRAMAEAGPLEAA